MGGNYNSFVGRWEEKYGPAFPDYVNVADMRKTTRPTSSGLLWFFLIHRLVGDPNEILLPDLFDNSRHSLSVGERKAIGGIGVDVDDYLPSSIWEIWIGEEDYQYYRVLSVSGNGMVLRWSNVGEGEYPAGLRRPSAPEENQHAGTHLRVNGANIKIISNTTAAPWYSWSLTVREGINLADYYSPGDEAMIVPLYSGRDISVLPRFGEDCPRPHQRG